MEVVKLENVSKVFVHGLFRHSSVVALRNINLNLDEKERISIIGESGSGKTTLARIMTGLEKPSSGRVYWLGKPIDEMSKKEFKETKLKIQYVYQDPYSSLNPAMKIKDILGDPLRKRGLRNIESKVVELLNLVKVTPPEYFMNKYPYHLSGGMRQRVAFARALTAEPKVIVADEPVSMIDMVLRKMLIDTLLELNSKLGISIALISHDIAIAYYFVRKGGQIYVMYRGFVVEQGSAEHIIGNPLHPYTRLLILAAPQHIKRYREWRFEEIGKYSKFLEAVPPLRGGEEGCPYAPRCPFATDECLHKSIELDEIEPGHFVRCIHVDRMPSFRVPWIQMG